MNFKKFIRDYNKLFGQLACFVTFFTYALVLCIGSTFVRVEFDFVLHLLLPLEISKVFTFIWCLQYSYSHDASRLVKGFASGLLWVIVVNMIITALDYDTNYFFVCQTVTSTLMLVLITLVSNQRAAYMRDKGESGTLHILSIVLGIFTAISLGLIYLSIQELRGGKNNYIYVISELVGGIIVQIFMFIAITILTPSKKRKKKHSDK